MVLVASAEAYLVYAMRGPYEHALGSYGRHIRNVAACIEFFNHLRNAFLRFEFICHLGAAERIVGHDIGLDVGGKLAFPACRSQNIAPCDFYAGVKPCVLRISEVVFIFIIVVLPCLQPVVASIEIQIYTVVLVDNVCNAGICIPEII